MQGIWKVHGRYNGVVYNGDVMGTSMCWVPVWAIHVHLNLIGYGIHREKEFRLIVKECNHQ